MNVFNDKSLSLGQGNDVLLSSSLSLPPYLPYSNLSNPSLSKSHAHLLQPFLTLLGKRASFYPNFKAAQALLEALHKEKKMLLSPSFFLFCFQPGSFRSSLFACSTSSFLQEVFNPNLKVHFQGVFPCSPQHSCLKKSLDSEVGSLLRE